MRVKITYSVEFDEVPSIVERKLFKVADSFDDLKHQIQPNSNEFDNIKKLDVIDAVRRKMAALDAQLEDCYSILAGYNKALADMKVPQSPPVEESQNVGN